MTKNTFSGLFDLSNAYDPGNTVTNQLSLFLETDLLNGLTGSPKSIFNNKIDPLSKSSLISSGLSSVLNNVLNISSGPTQKTSVFRKPSYTYSEYEKIIQKAPNLTLNLNPLNISIEAFNIGLNILEQLQNANHKDPVTQSKHDSETIDQFRQKVHNLNSRIEEYAAKIELALFATTIPEASVSTFKKFVYKYNVIYISEDIIKPGVAADQLLDLKAFLNSFIIVLKQENVLLKKQSITQISDTLQSFITEISKLQDKYKDYLYLITEDLRLLRSSVGPFVPKGLNQYINYSLPKTSNGAYSNYRQQYTSAGHSSVSVLATSFINKGMTLRDHIDIQESAQTYSQFSAASPVDGYGEIIQKTSSTETIPQSKTVGPLEKDEFDLFARKMAEKESSNSYSKVNQHGYLGKYQFGGPALVELGYVQPGTTTKALENDAVWVGKDSVKSKKDFLANTNDCQEKCFLEYTQRNYKTLVRSKVLATDSDRTEVAGYLAAAHLKGCGGARQLKNGVSTSDANGTETKSYYTEFASLFGKQSTEERQNNITKISMNTIPDSRSVSAPLSNATPKYPYNKVKEYEGGHFKEYDSTPGNERIQERHRTGSGYEIFADGTMKRFVVKDNYEVVMGNNYILVSGNCEIIVKGNCGIKADGDMNINAGNNLNMLVGGDFNISVAGNASRKIQGNELNNVLGDMTHSIGGFGKIAVEGDLMVDGSSASIISRGSDINILSAKKVNTIAVSDISTISSANIAQHSKGNNTQTSDGATIVSSQGAMTVASVGGAAVFGSSSTVSISAQGALHLVGTALKCSNDIETAIFAQRAQTAGRLGPAAPQPKTGQAATLPSSTQSSGSAFAAPDKTKKTIKETNIDADKTQSWQGGA